MDSKQENNCESGATVFLDLSKVRNMFKDETNGTTKN